MSDLLSIFPKDKKYNKLYRQFAVRTFILKNNLLPYVCSICGQEPIWQGKPLSLTLDHIDGNKDNWLLDNLRWVCPNCNIQLETHGNNKRIHVEEGNGWCSSCQQEKPLENFYVSTRQTRGYHNRCKQCDSEYKKKRRKKQ